jgi:hypothetical protein
MAAIDVAPRLIRRLQLPSFDYAGSRPMPRRYSALKAAI